MNLGASKPKPPRAHMRRRMPVWVACLLLVLMVPTIVFVRYGPGWAAAELAAFIASWLPAFLIKPVTWPSRHLSWAFTYFVFIMTVLLFPLVTLVVGLWLSPWLWLSPGWCLVISLGAGVLSVAGVWPAQLRYYSLQRQRRQP